MAVSVGYDFSTVEIEEKNWEVHVLATFRVIESKVRYFHYNRKRKQMARVFSEQSKT